MTEIKELDLGRELALVETPILLDEVDIITGLTNRELFKMYWSTDYFPSHVLQLAITILRPGPSLGDKGARKLYHLSAFEYRYNRKPTLGEYISLIYHTQQLIDGELTWIGNTQFRDEVTADIFKKNPPIFPTTPWKSREMWVAFYHRATQLNIDPGFNLTDVEKHFGTGKTEEGCPSNIPKYDLRNRVGNLPDDQVQRIIKAELIQHTVRKDLMKPYTLFTVEEVRNLKSGTQFRMRGMFAVVTTFCQP